MDVVHMYTAQRILDIHLEPLLLIDQLNTIKLKALTIDYINIKSGM